MKRLIARRFGGVSPKHGVGAEPSGESEGGTTWATLLTVGIVAGGLLLYFLSPNPTTQEAWNAAYRR